jgi:hypothetical protein
MTALVAWFLPLAAEVEDAATEGKKVITGMLIVGLIFVAVIALGQASRYVRHRRQDARARRAPQY